MSCIPDTEMIEDFVQLLQVLTLLTPIMLPYVLDKGWAVDHYYR